MSEKYCLKNSDASEPIKGNKTQAPREISVESVDKNSRPAPANKGGEPNGPKGRSL